MQFIPDWLETFFHEGEYIGLASNEMSIVLNLIVFDGLVFCCRSKLQSVQLHYMTFAYKLLFLLLKGVASVTGDCGYSSGHECENYSVPSSQNGSDVACSEGICNHDGDSLLCQRVELDDVCGDCVSSSPNLSPKNGSPKVSFIIA